MTDWLEALTQQLGVATTLIYPAVEKAYAKKQAAKKELQKKLGQDMSSVLEAILPATLLGDTFSNKLYLSAEAVESFSVADTNYEVKHIKSMSDPFGKDVIVSKAAPPDAVLLLDPTKMQMVKETVQETKHKYKKTKFNQDGVTTTTNSIDFVVNLDGTTSPAPYTKYVYKDGSTHIAYDGWVGVAEKKKAKATFVDEEDDDPIIQKIKKNNADIYGSIPKSAVDEVKPLKDLKVSIGVTPKKQVGGDPTAYASNLKKKGYPKPLDIVQVFKHQYGLKELFHVSIVAHVGMKDNIEYLSQQDGATAVQNLKEFFCPACKSEIEKGNIKIEQYA